MSDKPKGKPYSLVYVERGAATEDSQRFRNRLRGYLRELPDDYLGIIASLISLETGASVYYESVAKHVTECSLSDLLDNITHITEALEAIQTPRPRPHQSWLYFVERALREENVGYVVDDEGGVHPAHDEEFGASRSATIALLDKARYTAARKFFDEAMADLKQPRDTRDAVRKTFEAVENVAKLMFAEEICRLTSTEVKRFVQPAALDKLTGTERNSTGRMIESFAEWVNACQQYRHAAGEPEPDEPSLDFALLLVSTGAAHLRWLITIVLELRIFNI